VALLAAVMGDPRSEELLQREKRAGGEHLGAERVGLELLEVCLEDLELLASC
jgi:hypothetical protein